MENDENKKSAEQASGAQPAGGVAGMDRDEGQTLNGEVGGTGSDLEKASERLGGSGNKETGGSKTGGN